MSKISPCLWFDGEAEQAANFYVSLLPDSKIEHVQKNSVDSPASFATLTTTGYGDIAPVHPIARSLCNLESIFGQLYPATLLARLVTLEIAGRG